jgi:predicted RNase H-like HicB family nuclease
MMQYVVVLERTDNGYSAYAPDLPGCVAAGDTLEETETLMREAITGHLELLRERGEPVPQPASHATLVEVA